MDRGASHAFSRACRLIGCHLLGLKPEGPRNIENTTMETPGNDPAPEVTPESFLENLREAYNNKEESRFYVLSMLKEVLDDPYEYAERKDVEPLMTVLYILAGWRETAVFPLLVHLIRYPMFVLERVFSAPVFEDLPRILASLYDGDPAPLKVVIEDDDAHEEMRSQALQTLYVLHLGGRLPMAELKAYLEQLLNGGLKRKPSYLWESLMLLAGELPAPELFPEIYKAYDEGLMAGGTIPLSVMTEDLGRPSPAIPDDCILIDDPVAEVEAWLKYGSEERVGAPVERDQRVGRNDPCPCGSGKKYKKCCGRN
ncbi:MAG: DUF1186 domain-containing protein [Limisphaerales bacterium]